MAIAFLDKSSVAAKVSVGGSDSLLDDGSSTLRVALVETLGVDVTLVDSVSVDVTLV